MLRKIKKFFVNAFCIMMIMTVWAISLTGSVEGGAELNGFVALFLCIINIYVAVKFNAIVAVIGSFVLEIILHFAKYGVNEKMVIAISLILVILLICWKFDDIFSFLWNGLFGNSGTSYEKRTVYRKNNPKRESYKRNYDTMESNRNHYNTGEEWIEDNPKKKKDEEFYNIRSRDHSSDCPYICHQNSEGGREPYCCSMMERDISSNEYYHLCRYDWVALEECPIRKKYNKYC